MLAAHAVVTFAWASARPPASEAAPAFATAHCIKACAKSRARRLLKASLKNWTSSGPISSQAQKRVVYRAVGRERATGVEPATASLGGFLGPCGARVFRRR